VYFSRLIVKGGFFCSIFPFRTCILSTCWWSNEWPKHVESKVKKEPTRCHKSWSLFTFINSTCFGHHCAHLQENKTIAAYGVLHCNKRNIEVRCIMWYNGARNMLSLRKLINFSFCDILLVLSSLYLTDARSRERKKKVGSNNLKVQKV
jgi:hypothetical protein